MIGDLLTREWPGDQRVSGRFLMSNPFPTLVCCLLYFAGVRAGVAFMRRREALQLRWSLVLYNCLLVLLSLWIFIDGGRFGWFGHYSLSCAECDQSDSETNRRMINIVYVYYISKFIEMMDTMFFVVRKRNDLLTRLHLIHHGILPLSCWFTVKYVPGSSFPARLFESLTNAS